MPSALAKSCSSEEDYRYTQWRKMVPAWFFQLFSLFFVCKSSRFQRNLMVADS
jgi:steroid 5-alpha reductase family enzyme